MRWKKFKLENLIVPQWSTEREKILLPILRQVLYGDTNHEESQLDELISKICNLSEQEEAFIAENAKR